jgi:hypothetical protein
MTPGLMDTPHRTSAAVACCAVNVTQTKNKTIKMVVFIISFLVKISKPTFPSIILQIACVSTSFYGVIFQLFFLKISNPWRKFF